MQVRSVMGKKGKTIHTVAPDDTVLTLLQLFRDQKIGFATVKGSTGNIIATVSERDVCRAMAIAGGAGRSTPIKDIMVDNVVRCEMGDNLAKIRAIMTGQHTRHILVYDEGSLHGIISIGDVVKHHLDETLHEEEEMRHYIEGTGYSYTG